MRNGSMYKKKCENISHHEIEMLKYTIPTCRHQLFLTTNCSSVRVLTRIFTGMSSIENSQQQQLLEGGWVPIGAEEKIKQSFSTDTTTVVVAMGQAADRAAEGDGQDEGCCSGQVPDRTTVNICWIDLPAPCSCAENYCPRYGKFDAPLGWALATKIAGRGEQLRWGW